MFVEADRDSAGAARQALNKGTGTGQRDSAGAGQRWVSACGVSLGLADLAWRMRTQLMMQVSIMSLGSCSCQGYPTRNS